MPRKKLKNLNNFNKSGVIHAVANTARTIIRKRKKEAKENEPQTPSKRPEKLRKRNRPSLDASPSKPRDNQSFDSTPSRTSVLSRVISPLKTFPLFRSPFRHSSRTSLSSLSDGNASIHAPLFHNPDPTPDPDPFPPIDASVPVADSLETDPRALDADANEDAAREYAEEPEPDPSSDSDDEDGGLPHSLPGGIPWDDRKPPTEVMALEALEHLRTLLNPPATGNGKQKRRPPSKINGWSRKVLLEIEKMLNLYTGQGSITRGKWIESSKQADVALGGKGKIGGHSRTLREKAKKYILSREVPVNYYGTWAKSKLETHPELAEELKEHLVNVGKYVQVRDIVTFLNRPEVQGKYDLKDTVHLSTAKRWMHALRFRWVKNHKGQYVDGHEREDVVQYRQEVFLPAWYKMESKMRSWTGDNMEEMVDAINEAGKVIVVWFHDESIFYAHDRRTACWVADGSSPTPYAKGEGVSMMVADFVSADYGWLRSKDGKRSARVIFRPGKNRDGYFSNEEILDQLAVAMDILEKDYPDEQHVFVFDNATTHQKRADDAISARKMPKFMPQNGKNWGIEVNLKDADGKVVYDEKGEPKKTKIKMTHGFFRDGTPQDFYFGPDSDNPGIFKGMATILKERGIDISYVDDKGKEKELRAECPKFKCDPETPRCCCRRILFNEPDFAQGLSLIEIAAQKRGFSIIFLPKFHCEINFIEMCWGRAKYLYRLCDPSSKEDDLKRNMEQALNSITLAQMRRYARKAHRLIDAYNKKLDGKWAAWAGKRYRGHRVLPDSLMQDLETVKEKEAAMREKM